MRRQCAPVCSKEAVGWSKVTKLKHTPVMRLIDLKLSHEVKASCSGWTTRPNLTALFNIPFYMVLYNYPTAFVTGVKFKLGEQFN